MRWRNRLMVIAVMSGLFVVVFAMVALAEQRVLDESVCLDGSDWGNGSHLISGAWDGGSQSCGVNDFFIAAGDSLVIPSGSTFSLSQGEIAGGVIVNNGTFDFGFREVLVGQGGNLTNNYLARGGDLTIIEGSTADNYASYRGDHMFIAPGAGFTNRCGYTEFALAGGSGSYLDGSEQVVNEECVVTTTTTMPATTTTLAPAPPSTTAPTTTVVEVAAAEETLPFTGPEDAYREYGLAGMLLVAAGVAILLAVGVWTRSARDE